MIAATTRPTLIIRLGVPPTTNNAYSTGSDGRRHLTATAKAYKAEVGWLTKQSMTVPGAWPIVPPYALAFWLHLPDGRRRDLDNAVKLAQDAICGALGVDDSAIDELHLYRRLSRDNPRLDALLWHAKGG